MGRALILWLLTALPAGAAVPDAWLGTWRGEGVLTVTAEGDVRLRCEIRLAGSTTAGRSHLSGRCATARGARGFVWVMDRDGDRVRASSIDPPGEMTGTLAPDRLTLGAAGLDLDLSTQGAGLRLVLHGTDGQITGTGRVDLIRE